MSAFVQSLVPLRAALRREAPFVALWIALAFAFGFGAVVAYEPFREAAGLRRLIGELPVSVTAFLGLVDIGARARFLEAMLFGLLAPIGFLSFSIGVGTRAGVPAHGPTPSMSAGLDSDGDANLAAGVGGLAVGNVLLGFAMVLGVLVAGVLTRLAVPIGHLVSAVAADVALGFTFGVLGLLLAHRTGRIGFAALAATVIALAADTLNGIAPAVPAVGVVRYVSLVYYAEGGHPWSQGITIGHLAVLAAAAAGIIGLAWLAGRRQVGPTSGLAPQP